MPDHAEGPDHVVSMNPGLTRSSGRIAFPIVRASAIGDRTRSVNICHEVAGHRSDTAAGCDADQVLSQVENADDATTLERVMDFGRRR